MTAILSIRESVKEPLRSISDSLCDFFKREEVPSEEQMRRFLREIANSVCREDVVSGRLENLAWLTEALYNYSDFDDSEEIFFYKAACWAAVSIYRDVEEELAEQENAESLKGLLDTYADVFKIIEENPGICHSDIAKRLGNSVSRQSQIMSTLVDRGLIAGVKRGRNKDYYITSKTKRLNRRKDRNSYDRYIKYTQEHFRTIFLQEYEMGIGGANARPIAILEARRETIEMNAAISNQSSFFGNAYESASRPQPFPFGFDSIRPNRNLQMNAM